MSVLLTYCFSAKTDSVIGCHWCHTATSKCIDTNVLQIVDTAETHSFETSCSVALPQYMSNPQLITGDLRSLNRIFRPFFF